MGLSEQGRVCKKHRSHEEKHGVCASCLRYRLSQLDDHHSRDKAASSSSYSSASLSPSTSCRSDYESAETHHNQGMLKEKNKNKKKRVVRTHHRSASSTEIGSISFTAEAAVPAISGGGGVPNGLKKSRSVAASYSFAPQPARAMSYCVGDDMGIKNTHHHQQQYNLYNKGNNNKGSSEGCDNYGSEKKKKGGFWSKLLHLKGKNSGNHREVMIQQRRVY